MPAYCKFPSAFVSLLHKGLMDHQNFERARDFLSKLAIFGSTQILVMGLQFAVGIYIIRRLPVEDYALYTLANTVVGMMNVLSDGGISSGVMAQGGKVWQDREKLGGVLAAGFALRKAVSSVAVAISAPILIYLMLDHGAGYAVVTLLLVVLLGTFWLSLYGSLLGVPLALHQRVKETSKIQLQTSVLRSVLSLSAIFAIPSVASPLLANLISQGWATWKTKRVADGFFDPETPADPQARKAIVGMIQRTLPAAIYFCVSGQIMIWLLSVFGTTTAIAQVGALGRLSQLLLILSTVFSFIVVPRFARCMADRAKLFALSLYSLGVMGLICALICGFVAAFPQLALTVLGEKYSDLSVEVVLAILHGSVGLLAGTCLSLAVSRGWVIPPTIVVTLSIVFQVFGLLLIDVSDARAALLFGLFLNLSGLGTAFVYLLICILKVNNNTELSV
jgi:O-antigen/teichoic acid export membrane protein